MTKITNDIDEISAALIAGKTAIIPTDTVYGLAVSPTNTTAKTKIFEIKNRPTAFNLPIMVADIHDIYALGAIVTNEAEKLLSTHLIPGALTLVFKPDPDKVPNWLIGRVEFAIRIPDYQPVLELLRKTGPLLVTSANKHGLNTENKLHNVIAQLEHKPDIALDGGEINMIPSTIVNCALTPPKIERLGVVSAEKISEQIKVVW